MQSNWLEHERREHGAGLMEYSFIIALVAVAAIIAIVALGPTVRHLYCEMVAVMGETCEGMVEATRADYNAGTQELHVDATYNGGYDSEVTLNTSPGGVMEQRGDHYHIRFIQAGCPCEVTVLSSEGSSTTITVGP